MKKKLLSVLFLCSILLPILLSACTGQEKEKFSTYSFDYFDTVTTVIGYAESQEEFDRCAERILHILEEYHMLYTVYHRYEGMENLCTVNELVNGVHRTVKVDTRIIELLQYAKEIYQKTEGTVNVAMGSVLSIWHDYRTVGSSDPIKAKLPPKDTLEAASHHTDIECLVIDEENSTVTLTDPQMRLDVGAIAKGYAVEMVARQLEAEGITGYVLNVGGNVRTVGTRGDGDAWTVGIDHPDEEVEDAYLATLFFSENEALVTSGSYQRYYVVDGERYHHIIDPETLMPASGYVSVSVVTKDSALGDALSTALFCMSLEEGRKLIDSMPDTEALWVLNDGTQHRSDGFCAYETGEK